MTGVYDFDFNLSDGSSQSLADFKGKVLLIVNTASKCGFTPQFEGLERLHQRYGDKGLVIIGFPCNQFGHQDPGSDDEIMEFCQLNYGVSFPMAQKIDVNGSRAHPLYKFLKAEATGLLGSKNIKWNFTKFLVDAQGKVLERFAPSSTPEKIGEVIEGLLQLE
jgi:glutathione peroxidase